MADVSKITISNTSYNIKDSEARAIATDQTVGRVRPDNISIVVDNNGVISSIGSGGSNIYITTTESSLFGKTVTITDGYFTDTTIISMEGTATFSSFMGSGWLTISATNDNNETAYAYVNCSYYGSYRTTLSFFEAIVNLTTSERLLYGGPVYVTSDVAPDEVLTFDYSGATTYTVHVPGTYTFSIV